VSTPAIPPAYANIAFLLIPRFDGREIVDQARLKESLDAWARTAVAGMLAGERVVLEATDGIALVLFGDPARAMDMASALSHAPDALPLHVGLNYGPLALTSRGSDARVFGDGLSAAVAAARFASPQRMFVTVNFAKALEATAPARAVELVPAGEFTDSRVRLHAFYTPDKAVGEMRRRRLSAYALTGILMILLLGVLGRDVKERYYPPAPAIVQLEVKPRGDVLVDDVLQGRAPQLTEFEVPPGRHKVTIRNAGYPALELSLNLLPGERTVITHTFAAPRKAPPKPAEPKDDFWGGLRKRFGL
jgi:hypothetical protein